MCEGILAVAIPGLSPHERDAASELVALAGGKEVESRLGYKQKRELESLPAHIESLELELARLQTQLADPALYKTGGSAIADARESLARVQSELETTYERWGELDAMAPKD